MAKNVFAVPVFFVVMRETIEAGIILSILLSFVDQLTGQDPEQPGPPSTEASDGEEKGGSATPDVAPSLTNEQLLRKLRIQVWSGAVTGFVIALAIGAAFIGVFYSNKVHDLWSKSEEIWEGTFCIIAAGIILVMGITFLRLEQAKVKWRIKLAHAFQHRTSADGRSGIASRWVLFFLPFITVLREGLEAVVFAGGVSLSLPASSIPLAVVTGIIAGVAISLLIYASGSRVALHIFLVVSTCVLFLIGAGMLSSACGHFQLYVFNKGVGADVAELGDGPGSFDVHGNVWHLTYGNPEKPSNKGGGWGIFQAILGWNNTATIGTILCYCFYWITAITILVYMKWSEGRTTILGLKSKAYRDREAIAAAGAKPESETAGHQRLSGDEGKGGSEGDNAAPTHEIV